MPVNYHIDYVEGIVHVIFTGYITEEDICEGLTAVFTDKNWNYQFPHLWNGEGITRLDVNITFWDKIKDIVSKYVYPDKVGEGKTAVVVNSRNAYILAKAARTFFKWYKPFKVFTDSRSALAWIYLSPAEQFPPLVDEK